MNTYLPTDSEYIHVYGRTVNTVPMPLFWTASGVEFVTDSTEVWAELEADYEGSEVWIEIDVDFCPFQRMILPKGKANYCILRGFPEGQFRNIRIRLSSQPIQDDKKRKLLIHNITCDRQIEKAEAKKYKLEFVGDSITSGEGLTGSQSMDAWNPGIFGLRGHYGLTTADFFKADYSIVSQSGWGVCTGWDNNIKNIIPAYYTQICGVLAGEENDKLGAFGEYDFSSWQADAVVINLGTNDGGAFNQVPWTDPETGIAYKMTKGEGDRPNSESSEKFEAAAFSFLEKVRKNNPTAQIIWAYGMCDHYMEEYIKNACDRFVEETGDKKVIYLSLPEAKEEQLGSHGHPGVLDHKAAAGVLIDYLKTILV